MHLAAPDARSVSSQADRRRFLRRSNQQNQQNQQKQTTTMSVKGQCKTMQERDCLGYGPTHTPTPTHTHTYKHTHTNTHIQTPTPTHTHTHTRHKQCGSRSVGVGDGGADVLVVQSVEGVQTTQTASKHLLYDNTTQHHIIVVGSRITAL